MIKVIVADIDNTLTVKHKDISDLTKNTIKNIKDHAIFFGLASGRPIETLQALERKWKIKADFLIGDNGSEIYDGIKDERKLYYRMEVDWLKQSVEIMDEFDTNVYFRIGNDVYYGKEDTMTNGSKKYVDEDLKYHLVTDKSVLYKKAAAKIGFRVKTEDMERIEAKVSKCHLEGFIGLKTENTMYEFCNANASKGKLLKKFCDDHSIKIEEVCSFGDMNNDISLFEFSGMSVCMKNGSDDAKKAATFITDKSVDEDGFAHYVNGHILK